METFFFCLCMTVSACVRLEGSGLSRQGQACGVFQVDNFLENILQNSNDRLYVKEGANFVR
jgi:hypothetical protein